jgi:hypothetical protein
MDQAQSIRNTGHASDPPNLKRKHSDVVANMWRVERLLQGDDQETHKFRFRLQDRSLSYMWLVVGYLNRRRELKDLNES